MCVRFRLPQSARMYKVQVSTRPTSEIDRNLSREWPDRQGPEVGFRVERWLEKLVVV